MAPSRPMTPDPTEYAALKTPRSDTDNALKHHSPTLSAPPAWTTKYWYLGSLAQVVALGTALLYFVAASWYLTPYYWDIDAKIGVWWGVPSEEEREANPDAPPGHREMTLPTYLFFGLFVSFLLGVAAVHFLRMFNVRRITSRHILRVAMLLRRKPFAFGKLSYFGYGELLFLVVFLFGGNVFVSWYQYDAYVGFLVDSGREMTLDLYLGQIGLLFGYTCVWNMAFLFLPSTRNCAWMEFFGISYANGIKYHRWAGVMVVFTGVAHTVPYYWIWIREESWIAEALPCFTCSVERQSEGGHTWFNVFGELALICFLAIAFTSLPVVRRRLYETFYYVHHLFVPGVIFTVLHWPTTTWFIFPSFLIYLIDRAISSTSAFYPVQVVEFTALPDDIIKVVIARSPHDDGHYAIGQFVYLNAPTISKLQWHPFTISSSPRTSAQTLTILLKSLGDWTAELTTYARECEANRVLPTLYMDGYYGEPLDKYEAYPTLCLIGGGIGVTPLLAILEDMAVQLAHGSATLTQRVVFIFTFRELSLLEELHPVLAQLRELDPHEKYVSYRFYLTRLPSDDAVFDQPIDYARLTGKRTDQQHAKQLGAAGQRARTPEPFAKPLRTPGFAVVTYLVIIAVSVFLVAWLQYGNGKIVDGGKRSDLWMIQDTVEISVLFVCALVAYAAVWIERYMKQRHGVRSAVPDEKNVDWSVDVFSAFALASSDVHTLRDLVALYNVTLGSRPDMRELIREVHDAHRAFVSGRSEHGASNGVVGVFVSGPEALKTATEYAIADVGAHDFDIHAEEFEL